MSQTINKVVDEIESLFNAAELDNEPLTVRVDTGVLFTDAGKKQCTDIISAALSEREEKVAKLIEAAKRADVLLRNCPPTIRQVFDAGHIAIEASGLNPWCMNEGQATGSETIDFDDLHAALSALGESK